LRRCQWLPSKHCFTGHGGHAAAVANGRAVWLVNTKQTDEKPTILLRKKQQSLRVLTVGDGRNVHSPA